MQEDQRRCDYAVTMILSIFSALTLCKGEDSFLHLVVFLSVSTSRPTCLESDGMYFISCLHDLLPGYGISSA